MVPPYLDPAMTSKHTRTHLGEWCRNFFGSAIQSGSRFCYCGWAASICATQMETSVKLTLQESPHHQHRSAWTGRILTLVVSLSNDQVLQHNSTEAPKTSSPCLFLDLLGVLMVYMATNWFACSQNLLDCAWEFPRTTPIPHDSGNLNDII